MFIDFKKAEIAVIIPCYNESQTISKVVHDYRQALPSASIYVYDNNSIDDTANIAKEAGAVVRHEYRQGKGNVIRTMFRDIDADCYLMIDGDDTYPAENAQSMCELVLSGQADMVVGDRLSATYFEENTRKFHGFGNRFVKGLINLFWNPVESINDVMTGYRAFSPMFVKTFPILSHGFEIETEMTIHALDKIFLIKNISVNYRDRPNGSESKLNTYTDGVKVIMTIFNLYRDYKPLQFFGYGGAVLFLSSIVLFVPVLEEYFTTHLVLRIPTLIVSVILGLAGFLSYACGLILTTNAQNYKKI